MTGLCQIWDRGYNFKKDLLVYLYLVYKLSHIITGVISVILSLYICINCLDLFKNGIYIEDFVFFFCVLVFFYFIFFFPIDFINKSLMNIEKGNFKYGMTDYGKEYKMSSVPYMYAGGKAFYIAILFIINIILILPIKFIVSLKRKKESEN